MKKKEKFLVVEWAWSSFGYLFGILLGRNITFGVIVGAESGLAIGAIWDNMFDQSYIMHRKEGFYRIIS